MNFSPSSPANGTIYRITGGFLNSATSILKRVSLRIFKFIGSSSVFIEARKNFHFLLSKAPKNLETISAYT
jgi:hypothetical protein